ncbi:MAG: hypothetical protein E7653_02925 [Ruminococcaceae bacterium]|nr:hypothetical protein [Oscillospiraceae bacterium]
MGNWQKFRTSISTVAGKTIRKTEEVAETATLHMKLSSLRKSRDKLFMRLGRYTYKQLKTGASQAETISKIVSDLDKTNSAITKQKALIEEHQAEKERRKLEAQMAEDEMEKFEEQAFVNEVQVVVENTPMGEPVNFEEM